MAINQSDKQLNLVDQLVQLATDLDDALDEAAALLAQVPHAGTVTDELLASTPVLHHIDANDVLTLSYGLTSLLAWINDANRRDILRKVRK